jgi:hypothetical protein
MSTFVIRAKCFGYNDEVFYVAGNRIANVFHNQEQAENTYKQLEIKDARDFCLYEVESLFDMPEEELAALDAFVFERCGEHITDGDEISRDPLPDGLSDEDTFEFIQRANMQKYQLIRFDTEVKFYALWSTKQQDFIKEYDEFFAGLIYAQSPEQLKNNLSCIFNDYDGSPIILKGSLEELSDTPALLEATISTHQYLSFNAKKQELSIKDWNDDALYSVNGLLKQPLFEVREISIDTVQEIEASLAEEFGYGEEY